MWRPIYEVIHAPFVEETDIFHNIFCTYAKNPNQPQFITSDFKVVLKRMAL